MKVKQLFSLVIVSLLFAGFAFAQDAKKEGCGGDCCGSKVEMAHKTAMQQDTTREHGSHMQDSTHKHHMSGEHMKSDSGHGEMQMDERSPLIRTGMIDLQKIDKNNDGKVFQDPMDWNVISDEPGRCPVCEMKLREVTLKEARENLIKFDFEVKELK